MKTKPLSTFLPAIFLLVGVTGLAQSQRTTIKFISSGDRTLRVSCKIELSDINDTSKKVSLGEKDSVRWDFTRCYEIFLEPQDGLHFDKTVLCDENMTFVYLQPNEKFLPYQKHRTNIQRAVSSNSHTTNSGRSTGEHKGIESKSVIVLRSDNVQKQ